MMKTVPEYARDQNIAQLRPSEEPRTPDGNNHNHNVHLRPERSHDTN